MFNKQTLKKVVKKITLIEMVVVMVLIAGILYFVINRITNNDALKTEKNIPGHLKNYMTTLKMMKTGQLDGLKATTFKKLYTDGDNGAGKQGFKGVLSNCKFEQGEFKANETDFGNKFRIAAVGKNLATEVETGMVDSVRSILNKLGEWKITFLAGHKKDLLDTTSKEYNSLGNYVYIAVVEHAKAGDAEFFSSETGQKKYYNAAIMDSNGTIFDGLSSKNLIRSIASKNAGNLNDFNEITELNEKIMAKVKLDEGTGNCLTGSF